MAQPPQSVSPAAQPPAGQAGGIAMPVPPTSEPPLPMQGAAPGPGPVADAPQTVGTPAPVQSTSQTPQEAADSDVIEPAWIDKVKQVIAETRDDPYKQVRRINELKADYMQKRYNKTINLPDD